MKMTFKNFIDKVKHAGGFTVARKDIIPGSEFHVKKNGIEFDVTIVDIISQGHEAKIKTSDIDGERILPVDDVLSMLNNSEEVQKL